MVGKVFRLFDLVQLSEDSVDHADGVRRFRSRLAGVPCCCQTLHLPSVTQDKQHLWNLEKIQSPVTCMYKKGNNVFLGQSLMHSKLIVYYTSSPPFFPP